MECRRPSWYVASISLSLNLIRKFKGLLPPLLAHSPVLNHLYFESAADETAMLAAAHQYANCIFTLRSVSWQDVCNFYVLRDESGAIQLRAQKPYVAPGWQDWDGIGEWWEM
jgi:hypothetical protein